MDSGREWEDLSVVMTIGGRAASELKCGHGHIMTFKGNVK